MSAASGLLLLDTNIVIHRRYTHSTPTSAGGSASHIHWAKPIGCEGASAEAAMALGGGAIQPRPVGPSRQGSDAYFRLMRPF